MRHVTAHVPKPLLYLPGGTLLEHQLALLAELAVTQVFVIARQRRDDIGQALRGLLGVTLVQQKPPFTLLGALASAEALLTEPFIVIHGDNYFSHNLEYLARGANRMRGEARLHAVFCTDEMALQYDAAGRLASTGCYVLSPGVFRLVRELLNRDDLRSLTVALLESGAPVQAVPLRGWRANVNELGDLLAVSRRMLEEWSDNFHLRTAEAGYRRTTGTLEIQCPTWVSPDATVGHSELGPLVVVGPGSTVRGCLLRNAVVFPGVEIEGQQVADGVVIPASGGPLVLTSHGDVDHGQEREAEEEPSRLPPAADQ
jgi:NDP-sugar pyrophosphorylase family protein